MAHPISVVLIRIGRIRRCDRLLQFRPRLRLHRLRLITPPESHLLHMWTQGQHGSVARTQKPSVAGAARAPPARYRAPRSSRQPQQVHQYETVIKITTVKGTMRTRLLKKKRRQNCPSPLLRSTSLMTYRDITVFLLLSPTWNAYDSPVELVDSACFLENKFLVRKPTARELTTSNNALGNNNNNAFSTDVCAR